MMAEGWRESHPKLKAGPEIQCGLLKYFSRTFRYVLRPNHGRTGFQNSAREMFFITAQQFETQWRRNLGVFQHISFYFISIQNTTSLAQLHK